MNKTMSLGTALVAGIGYYTNILSIGEFVLLVYLGLILAIVMDDDESKEE